MYTSFDFKVLVIFKLLVNYFCFVAVKKTLSLYHNAFIKPYNKIINLDIHFK